MRRTCATRSGPADPQTRLTLCLVTNGAIRATSSQSLYELAWEQKIRQVDERGLKAGGSSKVGFGRMHQAGHGPRSHCGGRAR